MKKIAIIGAGIAGLTAGVYARKSGFDVTIYESHSIPGGASTSWRRKGYLFEGGIHWLTGSSAAHPLNRLWREVGALNDSVPIAYSEVFTAFEADGKRACAYRDLGRLRSHLLELAPEDAREIKRLCADVGHFTKLAMPVTDVKGVKTRETVSPTGPGFFSLLPALIRMPFYAGNSVGELCARFRNGAVRNLLLRMTDPEYTSLALVFTLATLASGDGGYPKGGSLAMAGRMAEYFLSLGGKIEYRTYVDRVTVENGEARGIDTGGKKIAADAVIVTQDAYVALNGLFDPPLDEEWACRLHASATPLLNTFVSVGYEADLSDVPEKLSFIPEEPLLCGGKPLDALSVNNYASCKGYAPEGCTAITAILSGDTYDWWKECREAGTYEAEKKRLAEGFTRALERKFPQLGGKLAVWDVATPLTYERYLHSWKGSWMSIVKKGEKMEKYPVKPASIRNLYFAGQRMQPPGGLPGALTSGREAAQWLCVDTETEFVSV